MERESFFISKEISDYLDNKSKQGFNLENSILWINEDYFESIPKTKPNSIVEFQKTIYGVDYKLEKYQVENFILKPKK